MPHDPNPPAFPSAVPPAKECVPLRVAVIGVGAMGKAHCRTMQEQVPSMRLCAVVDTHRESAEEAGRQFGVPAFASIVELVASRTAEAALVATPHPLHLSAVEACLRAGLHVLCEKPLAETVSAADSMLAAARENDRVLGVMFQRRFEPLFETALEFVRSGGVGEPCRTLLVLPDFRTQRYFDSNPWRATWTGEGGGVLINQAPHLMDLFVLLGGLPCELRGYTATRLHDIEVEDRADARLVYANGAVGHLYASTNEPNPQECIEIVGAHGSLAYRNQRLECCRFEPDLRTLSGTSEEVWGRPTLTALPQDTRTLPGGKMQALLMENFARHIRLGEPLRCDAASAAGSLELANAISLSSHLDAPVTLPIPRDRYDALLAQRRAQSRPRKRVVETLRATDPRLL